jgi:hypothetical protein
MPFCRGRGDIFDAAAGTIVPSGLISSWQHLSYLEAAIELVVATCGLDGANQIDGLQYLWPPAWDVSASHVVDDGCLHGDRLALSVP